jgi:hypothetical protein
MIGLISRGRWPRRWLLISLAVLVIAPLTGCDSGPAAPAGTLDNPTPTTTSSAIGPGTTAGTGTRSCVTSTAQGSCGPYRYPAIVTHGQDPGPTVDQNVWSPVHGWSQTLTAINPGDWYATANMPAGNTSVVSFPNTGQNIEWVHGAPPPLSSYSSIYSSFSENMNETSRTDAEAAYDIWLDNWNYEVMIQHDFSALRPRCGSIEATATFGGSGGVPVQSWKLCQFGTEIIWQLVGNEHSGSVDILTMLTWLEKHGYLPHGSGLTALSYGFEICSTGGRPEAFSVSRFSITAR